MCASIVVSFLVHNDGSRFHHQLWCVFGELWHTQLYRSKYRCRQLHFCQSYEHPPCRKFVEPKIVVSYRISETITSAGLRHDFFHRHFLGNDGSKLFHCCLSLNESNGSGFPLLFINGWRWWLYRAPGIHHSCMAAFEYLSPLVYTLVPSAHKDQTLLLFLVHMKALWTCSWFNKSSHNLWRDLLQQRSNNQSSNRVRGMMQQRLCRLPHVNSMQTEKCSNILRGPCLSKERQSEAEADLRNNFAFALIYVHAYRWMYSVWFDWQD